MAEAGIAGIQQIEIFIACRNLKDLDSMSKSDPFVVLSLFNDQNRQWTQYGQTEVITNNLNPEFSTSFKIGYIFEQQQHLSFTVYDYDGPGQQELIGTSNLTIHQIMGAANQTLIEDLKDSNERVTGKIILRGEEVMYCNDKVFLELYASKIDNVEFWSKSDPFLVFYRCREDGTWVKVYETEHISNNLNPR